MVDFAFTPAQVAFRKEVNAFFRDEIPAGWLGNNWLAEDAGEQRDLGLEFARRLAKRGWLMPDWPKEYGGAELPPVESTIFHEEMGWAEAPDLFLGEVGYIGPTVYTYGNDEQKARFLPGLASATAHWCQLYSEPGFGSDLAGIQMLAEHEGDDYVVNGSKIWTTNGDNAEYALLLARTDPSLPKHKGLSMFLMDLRVPGVSRRPLINAGGYHGFAQFFFDNVRIPRSGLLGEENAGWKIAMGNLNFERSSVGRVAAKCQRRLERARDRLRAADPKRERAVLWHRLANLFTETEVARQFTWRLTWMAEADIPINHEASVAKAFGTELSQRVARLQTEVDGLWGQAYEPGIGTWSASEYLITLSYTVESGTSEVQRNIIATRGLGLPRA